jgi:very-short-patch-repair endonuclease
VENSVKTYTEQWRIMRKARRALKTAQKVQRKLRENPSATHQAKASWKHLIAKSMRLNPTKYEAILYDAMVAEGIQFRPQVIVGPYIVDVLIEPKRVIEVDGGIHDRQPAYDLARDQFLWRRGYCVLRFPNKRITEELPSVIQEIKAFAEFSTGCAKED